jgi:hypothetical protein
MCVCVCVCMHASVLWSVWDVMIQSYLRVQEDAAASHTLVCKYILLGIAQEIVHLWRVAILFTERRNIDYIDTNLKNESI